MTKKNNRKNKRKNARVSSRNWEHSVVGAISNGTAITGVTYPDIVDLLHYNLGDAYSGYLTEVLGAGGMRDLPVDLDWKVHLDATLIGDSNLHTAGMRWADVYLISLKSGASIDIDPAFLQTDSPKLLFDQFCGNTDWRGQKIGTMKFKPYSACAERASLDLNITNVMKKYQSEYVKCAGDATTPEKLYLWVIGGVEDDGSMIYVSGLNRFNFNAPKGQQTLFH